MSAHYEEKAPLLARAEDFVSKNNALNFPADTVARIALTLANGDAGRAEHLLHSIDDFSYAAIVKSSENHVAT